LLSIFCLRRPLPYLHYSQVCYNIVHPPQMGSSVFSSCEQSSLHHLSRHCSYFHSLKMPLPSYPSGFYKLHNIRSVYNSIQFFVISNSLLSSLTLHNTSLFLK
jgi:hypothetical protein